jgi:UDP-N-acetylmuramoylalanine--D-glutamate ligase
MYKNVIILGAGESGVGAAILAVTKGYPVFVSDAKPIPDVFKAELIKYQIPFEESTHTIDKILLADVVIKSPGIPNNVPIIQAIKQKNISIISEIEFAYQHINNSKVIAITGTNGKSTTTHLTYNYIKNGGLNVSLVGNIGISFAKQVALNPTSWYVAEISSFQLDDCVTFKPYIAVLTNITPDHLDRYDYKIENYAASKFSITKNQTESDYFIYNLDDELTLEYLPNHIIKANKLEISMYKKVTRGAFIDKEEMHLFAGKEQADMNVNDFALQGTHNRYNTLAAVVATATAGIRKEAIAQSVITTKGLAHRFESIATIRGVHFINDSKATNINSTWYALETMKTPTILILGGVDKGNSYERIFDLVKEKVKGIICLGKDNKKIIDALQSKTGFILETTKIDDCVRLAFSKAEKGDTVLLAPACSSFDLFKNFEDRGAAFRQAVMNL